MYSTRVLDAVCCLRGRLSHARPRGVRSGVTRAKPRRWRLPKRLHPWTARRRRCGAAHLHSASAVIAAMCTVLCSSYLPATQHCAGGHGRATRQVCGVCSQVPAAVHAPAVPARRRGGPAAAARGADRGCRHDPGFPLHVRHGTVRHDMLLRILGSIMYRTGWHWAACWQPSCTGSSTCSHCPPSRPPPPTPQSSPSPRSC